MPLAMSDTEDDEPLVSSWMDHSARKSRPKLCLWFALVEFTNVVVFAGVLCILLKTSSRYRHQVDVHDCKSLHPDMQGRVSDLA